MHEFSLAQYDYDLPAAQIAQAPATPRDSSRLLALPRRGGACTHHRFHALPQLLRAGDLLVVNRTEVIPARLQLVRPGGGTGELLLERPLDGPMQTAQIWSGIGRPGAALRPGRSVHTRGGIRLEVLARDGMLVHVRAAAPLWSCLQAEGALPLPPYIQPSAARSVAQDYQTMFATAPGSVAAPTAALHFTPALMAALQAQGVELASLVLHVGLGTFLPIRPEHADDLRGHPMHPEWYSIPQATADAVGAARRRGGRVVAVGTTAMRALESWGGAGPLTGETRLFIWPGFQFRQVDALITNFHLPRTTLLLLTAAFAGREPVLGAYREAVRQGYRFFSYGDAMLLH